MRAVLEDAIRLWEKALGRRLFEHAYTAKLTINLVFDERQQATHDKQNLLPSLRQMEVSHANVTQSYDTWRRLYTERMQAYEAARTTHDEQTQGYNRHVQQWNAQGGAPPSVQQRLAVERAALDAARARLQADEGELREMVATLRALEERSKTLANHYTHQVQSYNALYGERRQFHKGEYNGKDITIYQYHDTADLTLVLAHELGHALGVAHVDDPKAVMHTFLAEQDLDALALAPADLQALTTACGRR